MNTRGESRINKEKDEVKENKCNNIYMSDSIGRGRIVQQFSRGINLY